MSTSASSPEDAPSNASASRPPSSDSSDTSVPVPTSKPGLSVRDRKLRALEASNAELASQIAALESEHASIANQLKDPAETTVKRHIKLLHNYNEIRDVGLGLMGLVAENRGVRVQDVMPDFGVNSND